MRKMLPVFLFLMVFLSCGGKGGKIQTGKQNEASKDILSQQSGYVGDENKGSTTKEVASGGDVEKGKQLYLQSCSACHGQDAEGIKGLGLPLKNSEFMASITDKELVDLIIRGRPATSPESKTKIDMPPKGGNPALSEEDIKDIVAYLRSL